ncbi:MAG: hypothetical protein JO222_03150, partial [Frankiales bacterium]|nr:hypothetical protein [Frankiales bacterium]
MRALVALAAASCIATSCSSSSPTRHPRPSDRPVPSPTSTAAALPPGTRALAGVEGGKLRPGRYVKPDFTPRLSFRLGRGWRAGHDIVGFFDVQLRHASTDEIAVQFAAPLGTRAATIIRDLTRSRGLRVSDQGSVTVGGRAAHRVLIDSRDPRLTPVRYRRIFAVTGGQLFIASGHRLQ